MHEALCRSSGTTLDILHAERRAADHSANIRSRGRPMAQERDGLLDGRLDGHAAGPKAPADDPDKFVDDALSAPGFEMTNKGLYWKPGGDKPSMWLSGEFEVIGETRNAQGGEWGFWLRW